jgi:hypothetical protein
MYAHRLTISIQIFRELLAHKIEEGGLVNPMMAPAVISHVWTRLVEQTPLHQAKKTFLGAILPTFTSTAGIATG